MNHKLMSFALVSILLLIVACSPTPTPPPVETSQPRLVASATPTSTAELPPPPAATPSEYPPTPLPAVTAELPPPPPPTEPLPLPTPQPTPCGPPLGWAAYTIQPGDTLYSISIRTGTSVEQLKLANCLISDQIYYGQPLFVPYLPVFSAPTVELLPPPPVATAEFIPAPAPGDKHLDIVPPAGPAGTKFTISIIEFTAGEAVNVRVFFGPTQEVVFRTSTTTDANGQRTVEFASQANNLVGEYVVWANGTQTRAVGKFSITQ